MSVDTITVDEAPETEPVSVAEAKRHLRILSPDIEDSEVLDTLTAAREWCENYTSRSLREDVTRTARYSTWPCSPIVLPYPPLRSIVSVKYYDTADADQTLDPSNYQVHLSTESLGYLAWDADVTLPGLSSRDDSVRIQFKSGYAVGTFPAKAKQAILLATTMFWGDGSGRDLQYAERASRLLLDACDWGSYA